MAPQAGKDNYWKNAQRSIFCKLVYQVFHARPRAGELTEIHRN
jgi:hypothetical protein